MVSGSAKRKKKKAASLNSSATSESEERRNRVLQELNEKVSTVLVEKSKKKRQCV